MTERTMNGCSSEIRENALPHGLFPAGKRHSIRQLLSHD